MCLVQQKVEFASMCHTLHSFNKIQQNMAKVIRKKEKYTIETIPNLNNQYIIWWQGATI